MLTHVTTKGQVTIPKSIRDRLGIVPGDAVAFDLAPDGRIVLVKPVGAGSGQQVRGVARRAGPGLSTDEIMALTRGED